MAACGCPWQRGRSGDISKELFTRHVACFLFFHVLKNLCELFYLGSCDGASENCLELYQECIRAGEHVRCLLVHVVWTVVVSFSGFELLHQKNEKR